MNTQEAYHVLGLPETSNNEEIQNKYNELFNDFQIRLTNAPTPNLKKLYQKNIEELQEAMKALNIHVSSSSPSPDLPSSSPVFQSTTSTKRQQETTTPQFTPPNTNKQNTTNQKQKSGNGMMVGGIIGVIGAAAAAFFGIMFFETQNKMTDYHAIKAQNDSLLVFKKNYSNGKLVIQNDGTQIMTIIAVIVEYTGANGDIVRFVDNSYNIDVKPGSSASLTRTKGDSQVWDGSVVSYSLVVKYSEHTKLRSGLWAREANKSDKILHLNLDTDTE